MALSGVVNTSNYKGNYMSLSWTATQSIINNTSTISWTLSGVRSVPDIEEAQLIIAPKVTIDGEVVYNNSGTIKFVNGVIASGTKTVAHNIDGTKTFSIFVQGTTSGGQLAGTGTFYLDMISRKSSATQAAAYIGSNAVVNVNAVSSVFTHTIKYRFGGLTGTIVTKGTGNSFTWTLPLGFYNEIPNAKSGTGDIICETYNGDSLIGTSTSSFTALALGEDCAPEIHYTLSELNEEVAVLTGGSERFIKHFSTIKCEAMAYGIYGASIVSQSYVYGSKTIEGSLLTIEKVEIPTIIFSATDSRGYTSNVAIELPLIEYIPLTCDISNDKPHIDGTFNFEISGKYYNGSFGAVNNGLLVEYRYCIAGTDNYTSWIRATPQAQGSSYKAAVYVTGLDYREAYKFEARAADEITIIYNQNKPPVRAIPVFDWSGEDFNFNVPVNFAAGTTGVIELTDTITDDSEAALSSKAVYDFIKVGEWTPTSGTVSSPTQAVGSYIKVGNTVTISFYLTGSVSSYNQFFKIGNLPFTPDSSIKWQCGGGNCIGATVPANQVFCCWSIEEGEIHGRTSVQAASNSARTSGYVSTTTGNTIHASGTICYQTSEW